MSAKLQLVNPSTLRVEWSPEPADAERDFRFLRDWIEKARARRAAREEKKKASGEAA